MMPSGAHSAIIMLMLWRKGESQVENKTVPGVKKKRFERFYTHVHPKRILLVVVVLALVAVAVAWGAHKYEENKIASQTVQIQGQGEYFSSHLDQLLKNPPAQDAATEKRIAYYDDLWRTYEDLGQKDKVLETFEKRRAISDKGLHYVDYFRTAGYYYEQHNLEKAQEYLDKAEQSLPAVDDEDSGYSRDSVLAIINEYREKYRQ
jgi:tetratricopeptide (TPR) repeat protein